jgi:polar amino acid transport system substrate-binding protein
VTELSRRAAIVGGLSLAVLRPGGAHAQGSADSTLARLRAAKKARIGIANQPPFSSLNPDGTVTGLGPEVAKTILGRLGIPEVEGTIATYGELIPGMLAGRWDIVAATLTISKERCTQVLFGDPIAFEGPCIFWVTGRSKDNPKTIADLVKLKAQVGVPTGGAAMRSLLDAGLTTDNVVQFQNDPALMDGVLAQRVQYGFTSHLPVRLQMRQRNLSLDIVFPVADSVTPGASNAFRLNDKDLHDAYQKELKAMKASGEWIAIANKFGFEIPKEFWDRTAVQQCEAISMRT